MPHFWQLPRAGRLGVLVEKVPARIHLEPVHLATELKVLSGLFIRSLMFFRVLLRKTKVLKVREKRTRRAPDNKSGLLVPNIA